MYEEFFTEWVDVRVILSSIRSINHNQLKNLIIAYCHICLGFEKKKIFSNDRN